MTVPGVAEEAGLVVVALPVQAGQTEGTAAELDSRLLL